MHLCVYCRYPTQSRVCAGPLSTMKGGNGMSWTSTLKPSQVFLTFSSSLFVVCTSVRVCPHTVVRCTLHNPGIEIRGRLASRTAKKEAGIKPVETDRQTPARKPPPPPTAVAV